MSPKPPSDFTILNIASLAQWQAHQGYAQNVALSSQGLSLPGFIEYVLNRVLGKPRGVADPIDLAVSRCGTLYFLDRQHLGIASYDLQQDRLEWLPCLGGEGVEPTQFARPQALAISDRNLFMGDVGNHRIVALARVNWQVRWLVDTAILARWAHEHLPAAPETQLTPIDLAVDAQDYLYALDEGARVIWKIDPVGRPVQAIGEGNLIQPVSLALDQTGADNLSCLLTYIRAGADRSRVADKVVDLLTRTWAKMAEADQEQVADILAALGPGSLAEHWQTLGMHLREGRPEALELVASQLEPLCARYQILLYVLDAAERQVLKFNHRGEFLGVTVDLKDFPDLQPHGLAVDQQGRLYLGDQRTAPGRGEEDRFIYRFDVTGQFLPPPITAYRGRTDGLVVDGHFNLYVLNRESSRQDITILTQEERYQAAGTYMSAALDSGVHDCSWHKLVLTAQFPEQTQVKVAYAMANAELPLSALTWSEPVINPPDALIVGPTGRYLWLRLELGGNGLASPQINQVQLYLPRLSYLRYLPAVYQENEASRDFLERFLALFETLFNQQESRIGNLTRLFDPLAAPVDFLPWLAQWLAAAVDENWPEAKRRQFLQQAAQLYKARGTRQGFAAQIELLTDQVPFIFEYFQMNCLTDPRGRVTYERLYGDDPFHFCILLKPGQVRDDREYLAVKRLVEADKPAHTSAGVRWLQPWFYLDAHTYLEVNTCLTKPEMRLEERSVISRDSVLTEPHEAGQVGRRSRLGVDTEIT
jgi:phage tail-like protein